MKLIILSGRSGSGKTAALQVLEDVGHYCVDNLPLNLLPELAVQLKEETHHLDHAAVGIDARNLPEQLGNFESVLKRAEQSGVHCEVVFLDAEDETLLTRFSATRRKHPLSTNEMSLSEAMAYEGRLLDPIHERADLLLDTTEMDVHTLRDLVRERVVRHEAGLSLLVESFAYKNGMPRDADLVFDVRVLPNPHWNTELRDLNGLDEPVIRFLDAQADSISMLDDITDFLLRWLPRYAANDRTYMTVAVGCTGGFHRSIYMVEKVARRLREHNYATQVRHQQIPVQ
jgi:UPF0042 nucleotide-binding protein